MSFLTPFIGFSQDTNHESILNKVNKIREKGYRCGNKKMPAVNPVTWNDKLFHSALSHAKEMKQYNYFSHVSRKGEQIGDRIQKYGYDWSFVGENIAKDQKDFDETLEDWLESQTHCEILLSPYIKEIALAKYGEYRVMHFGKEGWD